MPCHAVPCNAMPCDVTLNCFMFRTYMYVSYAMPCMPLHVRYAMLCCAMLCYDSSLCFAMLCRATWFMRVYVYIHICM